MFWLVIPLFMVLSIGFVRMFNQSKVRERQL